MPAGAVVAMKGNERPRERARPPAIIDESRLRLLYECSCAFAARTDLDELIPLVVERCREALRAHGAAVLLLDPQTDELYFPYVAQKIPSVADELRRVRFPAGLGVAGAVLRSGRASRVDDASSTPQFYRRVDQQTNSRTGPMLTVPLSTRQGRIGVLQVVNQLGQPCFDDADLHFLEALAPSISISIENARLYAHLLASQDDLREQVASLRQDLARQDPFGSIVGSSRPMREVVRLMEHAASSQLTVLLQGETGTGKELVARGIHDASRRAEQPFIAINCGALTETLLESELFGHRRGAFTGAVADRAGLFEAAAGGTILLDEIGEMPLAMQVKLLRVLQESEFLRVGETRPRKVDVRVIAATNRDLDAEVKRGGFRADLYYRLAAFPIRLPPLRERRDDIPALAAALLATISSRLGRGPVGIEPGALDLLVRFDWPGNVRELENEIARAVALLGAATRIRGEHLSEKIRGAATVAVRSMVAPTAPLRRPVPVP
ncbi:sigma 54-interacting transcriptional regulator, partial [Candidatus Binatia bacterium]|nr:sigma 54-interacting transcriptional regulator [Candidatus Binatia bacterium]